MFNLNTDFCLIFLPKKKGGETQLSAEKKSMPYSQSHIKVERESLIPKKVSSTIFYYFMYVPLKWLINNDSSEL